MKKRTAFWKHMEEAVSAVEAASIAGMEYEAFRMAMVREKFPIRSVKKGPKHGIAFYHPEDVLEWAANRKDGRKRGG